MNSGLEDENLDTLTLSGQGRPQQGPLWFWLAESHLSATFYYEF